MHEISDITLEDLIRRSFEQEVASLPAQGWQRRVRDTTTERLRHDTRHPRSHARLLMLGLAAAILVPLGALLAGPSHQPRPSGPIGPEAVLIRRAERAGEPELRVVAVDGVGTEREVAVIPPSAIEWYWLNHPREASLSTTGRLALRTGGKDEWYTLVFDLAHPAERAATFPFHSVAFDPKGRIWIPEPAGAFDADTPVDSFEIVDPVTDTRSVMTVPDEVRTRGIGSSGYGPFALDAEGALASDRYRQTDGWPDAWQIGTDGTQRPDLDLAWQGARWLSPIRYTLVLCADGAPLDCPWGPGVVRAGPTRGDGTWYEDPEYQPFDASWDADLDGLWVLRRAAGRVGTLNATLIHLDEPLRGEPSPSEMIPLTFPRFGESGPRILGLTPDDSLLAIGETVGIGGTVALIDLASGQVTFHEGRFAGFLQPSAGPGV